VATLAGFFGNVRRDRRRYELDTGRLEAALNPKLTSWEPGRAVRSGPDHDPRSAALNSAASKEADLTASLPSTRPTCMASHFPFPVEVGTPRSFNAFATPLKRCYAGRPEIGGVAARRKLDLADLPIKKPPAPSVRRGEVLSDLGSAGERGKQ
jgi:hypothetical protein